MAQTQPEQQPEEMQESSQTRQLTRLYQALRQNQLHDITAWSLAQREQSEQIQTWLLTDGLFARLYQLPLMAPDSLQLLDILARAHPIPELQPYHKLLETPDFHTRLFQLLHPASAAAGLDAYPSEPLNSLLRFWADRLYRVDHLQRLRSEATPQHPTFNPTAFIIMGENPVIMDENSAGKSDILPLELYLRTWIQNPDAGEPLAHQAKQHGMETYLAVLQLEKGRSLSTPADAIAALKQALSQAKAIQSPLLQLQALLELAIVDTEAAASHAEGAKSLLLSLPEGPLKSFGRKFWADDLLRQNRLAEAREGYRALAASGEAWLLKWLLSSFEQSLDPEMWPLVESWIHHPHEALAQQALAVWLRLLPAQDPFTAIERLDLGLSEAHKGYLLAHLPNNPPDKAHAYLRAALSSGSVPQQLGALSQLKQLTYGIGHQALLAQEVIALLKSPQAQVQMAALDYLSHIKRYDPAVLSLIQNTDVTQRSQVLWHLLPIADQVPSAAILPLLQADDPQHRLHALALLVLKGERSGLDDFLLLWREPRFLNLAGLEARLAEALKTGAISWASWRQALEQSLLTSQGAEDEIIYDKLLGSLNSLEPLPAQALAQLDALLMHADAFIRGQAIKRLRWAPREPARNRRIAELATANHNEELRAKALDYLADSPDPAWRELFQQALKDPSEDAKQAARRYFAQTDPAELLTGLTQDDTDETVLDLLKSLTDTQFDPQLLKPKIRALFEQGSPAFRQALVSQLLHSESSYLDPDMLNSLIGRQAPHPELLQFLLRKPVWLEPASFERLLSSPDPSARAAALLLAQAKGDVSVYEALMPLLADQAMVPAALVRDYHLSPQGTEQVSMRQLTLRVLIKLNQSRTLPLLPTFLKDPDPTLRWFALSWLKVAKDLPPEAELEPLLQDPDLGVRFEALRLSAHRLPPSADSRMPEHRLSPERWLAFVRATDQEISSQARFIFETHPLLNAQHLVSLLEDPDPELKRLAQTMMAKLAHPNQPMSLAQILAQLSESPHRIYHWQRSGLPEGLSWEQVYAGMLALIKDMPAEESYLPTSLAGVLASIKHSEALPDLLKLLDTHHIASYVFQKIAKPEQIPLFAELLARAEHPRQTELGIRLLTHLKASQYLHLVLPYLSDPDREIQAAAIHAVGELGSEADRARLLPLLHLKPMPYDLITALSKRPLPQAFEQIVALLEHPDSDIRSQAIFLAGAWQIQDALPALLRQLDAPAAKNTALKNMLIAALGKIGDPSAIPVLRKQLKLQPNALASIQSLYALGDVETARSALLAYLDQASSVQRIAGLELIQYVEDTDLIPYLIELLPSRESGQSAQSEGAYELGELASNILASLACLEIIPALIRSLPKLYPDRRDYLDDCIASIVETHPIWPPEALAELRQLTSHPDPIIRQAAQKWLPKPDSE